MENNSLKETFSDDSHEQPVEVDAEELQYQNQKLLQQIERQKQEFVDLEANVKELEKMQDSYDGSLIEASQHWNQLEDDLGHLGACVGGGQNIFPDFDGADYSRGSIPSCPAEEMFLCRLAQRDSIQAHGNEETVKFVEEALASRHTFTRSVLSALEDSINDQRDKTEGIARALDGNLSSEEAIMELSKIDDMMKQEASNLRAAIDILHSKNKEYCDQIEAYKGIHSVDQSGLKGLAGELDDAMAELEENRRKLMNLQMQKDIANGMQFPSSGAANGHLSPEKSAERTISLRDLKISTEEAKILATNRYAEHKEAQQENLLLSKQLEDLQAEFTDDKYVRSSRAYTMLNDQQQHWNAERERYRALVDALQVERSLILRRDKEVIAKIESADAARIAVDTVDSRVEELELQLQKYMAEANDLEVQLEEATQDSGRKDIKDEFRVMASSLSKELDMVEGQLKRWHEISHETISLREKDKSLKALLNEKTNEHKDLVNTCDAQEKSIKSLKELIEKLQKDKLEKQFVVDMYSKENNDNRTLADIKESESRACAQSELLKNAFAEHGLELRVKAAYEAEDACKLRLSTAEAELEDLRSQLDSSERDIHEMTEALRIKDLEAEAYISEIETIGQAYEDMQTQNQHLLQQVTARDDYNIKLVSESVKTKQAHNTLRSEKQALTNQLQQTNTLLDSLRTRITQGEEQMIARLNEASKSSEEERQLSVKCETARWELTDAEKELKWLKSAVSSSEKAQEQIQQDIDDAKTELENERNSRTVLEEEINELKRSIEEMTSQTGEAATQKLQEEIKFCKSVLQCLVCRDRPKEVVIVKCYHLFCNQCIQKNLETRHRKCPACGTAFGQNDIRFVKI